MVLCPPRARKGLVPTHPPEPISPRARPQSAATDSGSWPHRLAGTQHRLSSRERRAGARTPKSPPGVKPKHAGGRAAGAERDLRAREPAAPARLLPARSAALKLPGPSGAGRAGACRTNWPAAGGHPHCSRLPGGRLRAAGRQHAGQPWAGGHGGGPSGAGGRRGSCWRRCGVGAGASLPR